MAGSTLSSGYLRAAVLAAAVGLGVYYLVSRTAEHLGSDDLRKKLQELEVELEHVRKNRRADRAGRVRAEAKLREMQTALSATQAAAAATQSDAASENADASTSAAAGASPGQPAVYPFKPIGTLRTCFTTRNGTPRQPLLVPAARAVLQLAPGVPFACLEGLEQYSHCWVLYVFHDNTDMGKVLPLGARKSVIKAKISVPRLDGGKMGVLATRSPHRPVPIGLSVARVLEVSKGRLVLGGVDIVDGSPVLDIKPYVPFCDGVAGAEAPAWVQAEATHEPLKISGVDIDAAAADAIATAWREVSSARASTSAACSSSSSGRRSRPGRNNTGGSLYASAEQFLELVRQVLSRDIRSLHQRLHEFTAQTLYHVILEGVNIQYEIDETLGRVHVIGGEVDRGDGWVLNPLADDAELAAEAAAAKAAVVSATPTTAHGTAAHANAVGTQSSAKHAAAAAPTTAHAAAATGDQQPAEGQMATSNASASQGLPSTSDAGGSHGALGGLRLNTVALADELEAPGTPHDSHTVRPQTPAEG